MNANLNTIKISSGRLQQVIAYALFALAPIQLGSHFWPNSEFAYRLDYLAVDIYLTELLALGLIAVSIYSYLKDCSLRDAITIALRRTNLPLIVIIVWMAIQVIWAVFPVIQVWWVVRVLLYLGLYLSLRSISLSPAIVLRISVVQVTVLCVVSFLQVSQGQTLQGVWYWLGERRLSLMTPNVASMMIDHQRWLRAYASFSHPNVLAGYIWLLLAYLSLDYPRQSRQTTVSHKTLHLAVALISVVILLLTWSQTTWLALVVSLLMGIYSIKLVNWQWLMVVCMWMASPIALQMLTPWIDSQEVFERVAYSFSLQHLTVFEWIGGVGVHGMLAVMAPSLPRMLLPQPIHHVGWYLLSSLGIVGMCLLSLVGFAWIRAYAKQLTIPKVQAVVIGILILASLDHYLLTQVQTRILLVFVCVSMVKQPTS